MTKSLRKVCVFYMTHSVDIGAVFKTVEDVWVERVFQKSRPDSAS